VISACATIGVEILPPMMKNMRAGSSKNQGAQEERSSRNTGVRGRMAKELDELPSFPF
jgi:hypothetical protein